MAIVLLLIFLKLFGNLQASHCDRELDYNPTYGYEITCENLSDDSESLLKNITVSKENVLNINNSNLTKVTPDLFLNVREIKTLSITNSTFLFGADEIIFANLTQLQHLFIEDTKFNFNSYVTRGLDNLEELSLINCDLKIIRNDTFVRFEKLEKLTLSRNHFRSILDIPLCEVPALRHLNLEHNEIQEIEDNFFLCLENQTESAVLLNGKDFHFKYHSDHSYSQARSNLNLIELNLSHNNITQIAHLEWASSLKNLNLSYNGLHSIDGKLFSTLHDLETLSLQNNLLRNIDAQAFLTLKNLKRIDLENNVLFDVCVKNLLNLEEVNLSRNFLTSSSLTHLTGLSNLQQLFLKDNKIQELPLNVFDGFVSLELLDLSNNRIVFSRDSFKNLKNLKQLSLRNNRIRIISDSSFTNLTLLEVLDISENSIATFDDCKIFVGLENLQVLNMSHNMIENISYDLLSPLRNLQVLDISGNRLQNFHVSLISLLPSLRVINIKSNLLPCSILATIISFLKSKDISYTIHEKFEYDRQNVAGIYCEEISSRVYTEKGASGNRMSSLGVIFLTVVTCILLVFVLYKCVLCTRRRHYRMDEIELL